VISYSYPVNGIEYHEGECVMINTRKIKAIMVERGFTQIELAKATGICKNSINAKINGKSMFNCDEVDAVCKALQISDPVMKAEIFLS